MKQNFDRIVGYAAFEDVNDQKLRYKINVIKEILSNRNNKVTYKNILVAGCGDGMEAKAVREIFKSRVIGVDVSLKKNIQEGNDYILLKQDLSKLSFQDNYFDLIYSYHALEHVSEPEEVMKELYRVLQKTNILFIGFPNKNRLIGYIGAHNNVSWKEKLIWNLKDYKDRLTGKFENYLGAHAGFTEKEFITIANKFYTEVIPVRNDYMKLKYFKEKKLIDLIIKTKLNEFLFPSNYYLCIK